MDKVELLAPAGNLESVYAAVQNGADAVYLGGNKFSARAFADNFDEVTLLEAADYCHIYGVKLYVTLNTSIKENELKEAKEYIDYLYIIGVDALIIQDLGIFNIVKECYPDFPMHASTQMTVHNGEGAKLLTENGFKRIVLARELNLKEIQYISKELAIETEVFVHGALCVCYSGMCLMSSIIGGRSGNRGKCAQPCRLPYTLKNENQGSEKKGYLLSPKDICTIDILKEIIQSGARSLKIEGRMKRPEYVAGVVSIYRKAIDSIYSGETFNLEENYNILLELFNREGFSKGYMEGYTGKAMMALNFPKNTGLLLGRVEKDLSVTLEESLALKDGLRYGEDGFTVAKIVKNNKEVLQAAKGDNVRLYPDKYHFGDTLYKTSDVALLDKLQKSYSNPFGKKRGISLKVFFELEKPVVVMANFDGNEIVLEGDIVQKAIDRPISKERIAEALKKTGDTPFSFDEIDFITFEEGFIPVAAINKIRRDIIAKTIEIVNDMSRRAIGKVKDVIYEDASTFNTEMIPETLITVRSIEGIEAVIEAGYQSFAIDMFSKKEKNLDIKKYSSANQIYLRVPNIIKEEFEQVAKSLDSYLPYIKGIITGNLGIINRYKGKIKLIGDYKLNVYNSPSVHFYSKYLDMLCLSVELNKKEIGELLKNIHKPVSILAYGRIELMVSEYCPVGSCTEDGNSKNCGACRGESFVLKDRKNEEFLVTLDSFCRSHVYNSKPVNLISNIKEIRNTGIENFRLDFIYESYAEIKSILESFKKESFTGDMSKFTRGHFKRGVE